METNNHPAHFKLCLRSIVIIYTVDSLISRDESVQPLEEKSKIPFFSPLYTQVKGVIFKKKKNLFYILFSSSAISGYIRARYE
jgi:hypothetical protein